MNNSYQYDYKEVSEEMARTSGNNLYKINFQAATLI
jgi:hypothetical protein